MNPTSEPLPTQYSAVDARARFMELIQRVRFGRERLTVTSNGKPAAAIVTLEDLKLLQLLDDQGLRNTLAGHLTQDAGKPTIDWEDFKHRQSAQSQKLPDSK